MHELFCMTGGNSPISDLGGGRRRPAVKKNTDCDLNMCFLLQTFYGICLSTYFAKYSFSREHVK
jgi:hypothetical protein